MNKKIKLRILKIIAALCCISSGALPLKHGYVSEAIVFLIGVPLAVFLATWAFTPLEYAYKQTTRSLIGLTNVFLLLALSAKFPSGWVAGSIFCGVLIAEGVVGSVFNYLSERKNNACK